MKRAINFLVLCGLLAGILSTPTPVSAQNQTPPQAESYTGLPLCLPDAYLVNPQDCVPLGPSTLITDLAKKGIQYPFVPIPAAHPDPSLDEVDLKFAKVNVEPPEAAPLFTSLEAAVAGTSPTGHLKPGRLIYVSYLQRADVNNNAYLYLRDGAWMRASPADYHRFQGLVFKRNPTTSLGWIIEATTTRPEPSYQAAESTTSLPRETVVQIYSMQEIAGTKWYMIGLNQWVERRYIRQLELSTTPPAGVTGNRWIDINLYEQTLSVYEDGRLLFAALIASGMEPYYTQPGVFQIYKKKPTETMSGAFEADQSDYYYLQDVPWTMYFDKERAIHGAYWRAWFGYPQSHGCINMSVGDSRWVYDWAVEGDFVYVHDPSGATPTDPAKYSNGGA